MLDPAERSGGGRHSRADGMRACLSWCVLRAVQVDRRGPAPPSALGARRGREGSRDSVELDGSATAAASSSDANERRGLGAEAKAGLPPGKKKRCNRCSSSSSVR